MISSDTKPELWSCYTFELYSGRRDEYWWFYYSKLIVIHIDTRLYLQKYSWAKNNVAQYFITEEMNMRLWSCWDYWMAKISIATLLSLYTAASVYYLFIIRYFSFLTNSNEHLSKPICVSIINVCYSVQCIETPHFELNMLTIREILFHTLVLCINFFTQTMFKLLY